MNRLLEDQPDTKLQVSLAGSRIRATECDRAARQASEVAVVVITKTPQPESFKRRDVVRE